MTSHRPDRASVSPAVHQNPAGDIVVLDDLGEVVLLPRLWDFELVSRGDAELTLASGSGMVARVTARGTVGIRVRRVGPSVSDLPHRHPLTAS